MWTLIGFFVAGWVVTFLIYKLQFTKRPSVMSAMMVGTILIAYAIAIKHPEQCGFISKIEFIQEADLVARQVFTGLGLMVSLLFGTLTCLFHIIVIPKKGG